MAKKNPQFQKKLIEKRDIAEISVIFIFRMKKLSRKWSENLKRIFLFPIVIHILVQTIFLII